MSHSVGQVSRFAGVTVRTLHHYDEIGLLSPSGRTLAGYRRYEQDDLDRLQQILFYRELGFPLDEISTLLDDPTVDAREHLRRQHALLSDRIERLQQMVKAVEHTMEARAMGTNLTPEEQFEVFGAWRPGPGYAERAETRWGHTQEWREGMPKAAAMTKEEWVADQQRVADWLTDLEALLDSGAAPDSGAALALAERHRDMLKKFFDCSYPVQVSIAESYVTDPEQFAFLVRPERQRPGMAEFIRDAVKANAANAG
ncbi:MULTISPECIES: MerR family transcriptional regulator [unclassified Crossiella]|uniref:MerR family transcriptional regulator n=1 Tax=unclassified Crossiella TaxID=2620835 RepID=UPI001FFF1D63|nr:MULTISPECIES: MerR family transcriptional regulator [unclassified Crossiella]MCK2238909.1 MerR family transcriptional regulator [Crossiella sp. S99.2]MCK2251521.1 MerR family transcriptional regulator [Crossiella sp. S99.1]